MKLNYTQSYIMVVDESSGRGNALAFIVSIIARLI